MKRYNKFLAAALAVQILIAGGIYFGSQPPAADQIQMALLNSEQTHIDRITVEEGDGQQTTLSKVDGKWLLPDYYQLPASQSKVEDILSKLTTTHSGWPVATTQSSGERFEVSEDNFQKRLALYQGDKTIQTIYMGTSPGFRQIHIRLNNENEVYSVKLNSYDFPIQQAQWLDKTLLQPKGDIASIKGADFDLIKQAERWKTAEGEGEVINTSLEKITNTLAHLMIQSAEAKSVDEVNHELTVKTAGNIFTYQFFESGDSYYLRRNDYSQAFKINKTDYESITEQSAQQLVRYPAQEKHNAVVGSHEKEQSEKTLTTPPHKVTENNS